MPEAVGACVCVKLGLMEGGLEREREAGRAGYREGGSQLARVSARARKREEREREKEEERRKESERVRERDTADILHAITCVDADVHACRRDFTLAQVVHAASRIRHNSFAVLLL